MLFAISNLYVYTKPVGLIYTNVPESRAFRPLQPDSALLRIEASGWQLLFSSILREEKTVDVDLSGLIEREWIVFSNQIGYINRQFPSNQRVVSLSPDTLFFDFSTQTEKKVPVVVRHDLQFDRQFGLIDRPQLSSEYVTVRGASEEIAAIDYVATDTLRAKGIDGSVRHTLGLDVRNYDNVKVLPAHIDVLFPVGELTEKILQIPISVVNDDVVRSVKVLPSKVSLTVLVSLRDYTSLSSSDFEAVVDLKSWTDWQVESLPVTITRKPEFCQIVRMEPQNVDFFVNN